MQPHPQHTGTNKRTATCCRRYHVALASPAGYASTAEVDKELSADLLRQITANNLPGHATGVTRLGFPKGSLQNSTHELFERAGTS